MSEIPDLAMHYITYNIMLWNNAVNKNSLFWFM